MKGPSNAKTIHLHLYWVLICIHGIGQIGISHKLQWKFFLFTMNIVMQWVDGFR